MSCWFPPTADRVFLPLGNERTEHETTIHWPPQPRWCMGPLGFSQAKFASIDEHCRACAQEINAGDWDVLFANSCWLSGAAPIGRHVNFSKVLYLQEPYRPLFEATFNGTERGASCRVDASKPSLASRTRRILESEGLRIQAEEERRSAASYERILVNSIFSRESVSRAYGQPGAEAHVCYLGVDTELFRPTGAEKERVVVGLGSITPAKGIELAVRAIGTIPKLHRPPFVWIANNNNPPYRETLEKLAAEVDVRLEFRTEISDAEVVTLLSRASVLLYTARLEPFGFAPLEANACGTPVVAIAEGGIRETVLDGVNGFLVEDINAESLGSKVLELLDDPSRVREMGMKAREHVVHKWTWSRAIDRLEGHLLEVAAHS